ncbi:hypothetical protein PG988_007600 [Apiospora saccharicola]
MAFNWDLHFDEVRTLYIKDGKTQQHIQKLFKEKYGCTASKKQWTQQLGRWKLKKNLSEKDWKYISHVAKRRKARNKDSLVFVSGLQITPDRIETGRRNHGFALTRSSYRISPSPEVPSDVVVSVRTPVPTIGFVEQSLPWLRFQSKLSDYEDFTSHKSTCPVPTHSASLSGESDILSLDLGPGFNVLGTGMHEFDFIYREVACYMPDEAPNSHNERAYQIAHGQGINSLHAMLEVLTFLLSNNMLYEKLGHDQDTYDRCVIGMLESYLKIASSFNGISFSKDRTIQVVLDEALASIIRSGRLDLLKTLVASNPSVKTRLNRPMTRDLVFWGLAMPIEVALSNGNVSTADYLWSNGIRIDESGINTIPDFRGDSWHRWKVHDTLETVDWILTRCTKIRESKLLHILSLLEDGQHSEAPAALMLEKLWQMETSEHLQSPASALLYAIRFNNQKSIENFMSCGGRLFQDTVPQGIDIEMYNAVEDTPDMAVGSRVSGSAIAISKGYLGEALITAAAIGNLDAAEFLILGTSVDVNWISRYHIGREYGKPVIFYPGTPYEARRPLGAALAHRQAGAIKMLLRAGANVTEDDIVEAIQQDMFDLLQSHSGFDMEITAPILISIVQNECLGLLADIELGTLPWTEDQAEGETALGNAIVMRETHLISSLRENGCLQYDPFALVAAVLTVKSSNDRSMIKYMLGLRAMNTLRNEHIDACSYLELAAFFIAIQFQDIETLKILKRFGLFERFQALIPDDKTDSKFVVDEWNFYDSYSGPSSFFFERCHCLNQAYYKNTRTSLVDVFSTTSAGVSNAVGSLLGVAVGVGANRLTLQFLLQNLPKPNVYDIFIGVLNYDTDPLLIHDMIDLATDIKSWEPTDHSTILGEVIYVGLDCVASRLLEMGVNVNACMRDNFGYGHGNVLLSACEKGNLSMVQKLLELGAEVDSRLYREPTALQIAVKIGHVQLATLLLDHDADCNAGGYITAIEYAAEKGHIDMIELLLARGVQTKGIYRRQYFRAIKFASEQAHYVAESILRNHRPWDAEDQNAFEKTHI